MKREKKPLKALKLGNYGIHEHRLADNPMEAKALLAFQKLNKSTAGPMRHRDVIDHLVHHHQVEAFAGENQRRSVCTVIQWLGSPVGFAWLVDTFGHEIVEEMKGRAGTQAVQVGEVYAATGGNDTRRLRVESKHAEGVWACRNLATSRLSYNKETTLLHGRWKRVSG